MLFNAPNALDRTFRQINPTENILMLQEDDIKSHNHMQGAHSHSLPNIEVSFPAYLQRKDY